MKLSIVMALFILVAAALAYALKQEVPAPVKESFIKLFPNARHVLWEMESETEWEADFRLGNKKYSASFSETGTWLQTEEEISARQLPETLRELIAKEFQGYVLEEAEKIESLSGTAYELELKNGRKGLEVVVDSHGLILKTISDEEREEND